ncbi:hypothetical protein EMPS_08167 [Entomortierella parvispora]|uniref:Signal transduction histidine kinase dimerisation/phosphoacceptor domain-containing protein n=1 Tax=Entomortierella parvispora TaxID=205924 RepID=A0A9P3HFM8_9FUNG|nr:hypothetical protein EMPS_08167 [Entomortierella parvispora]
MCESIGKNTAAHEVAELASRSKPEFLASTSHEFRTPMNGVIGGTSLTLETELTRLQRENLVIVSHLAHSFLIFPRVRGSKLFKTTRVTSLEQASALMPNFGSQEKSICDVVIVDNVKDIRKDIRKIKEIAMLRFPPIVLLSMTIPYISMTIPYISMKLCQELGIVSYLNPPVQLPELMSALLPLFESASALLRDEEHAILLHILLS